VGPMEMFERAASSASGLARSARADQMSMSTPCSEWDVAALLEHMAGGPTYLLGALGVNDDGSSARRSRSLPGASPQDVLLGAMGREPRR
jgi:hypothetical protein